MSSEPLVELRGVTKDHHGLRPLRISAFTLHEGESVALLGFDRVTAEVLVNLVTGAVLPDSGDVTVLGRTTASITQPDDWVFTLDQFGLLSERAVLLDQLTAEQNLAMPLSLELDELPDQVRSAVRRIAAEVGLPADNLRTPMTDLSTPLRLRVRLGRALALDPRVLIAEHPNASLAPADVAPLAADLSRVVATRHIASLVITADPAFAHGVSDRVLTLQPATGELKRAASWRRWFG